MYAAQPTTTRRRQHVSHDCEPEKEEVEGLHCKFQSACVVKRFH